MEPLPYYVKPAYAIASVDHALRLIQLLRDTGSVRVSVAARELGIAPSTAHRLLAMLVYRGFAVQDDERAYAPGPALGAQPAPAPLARALRAAALPHLEDLAARVDATSSLLLRVGSKVRFLACVEAASIARVGDRTGTVLDARRASGGKALLAELDQRALERLYRAPAAELAGDWLDEHAFTTLLRTLDQVRASGVAFNRQGTESGVSGVGVVVRAASGEALAALALAVPAARERSLATPAMRSELEATRAAIQHSLAGRRASGA